MDEDEVVNYERKGSRGLGGRGGKPRIEDSDDDDVDPGGVYVMQHDKQLKRF